MWLIAKLMQAMLGLIFGAFVLPFQLFKDIRGIAIAAKGM